MSDFERKILKENEELRNQLSEARKEVDYAINFFNKNEQFGVVGILKDIKNKLKEKGDETKSRN